MRKYFFIGIGVDGINYYAVDIDTVAAIEENEPYSHFTIEEIENGRLVRLRPKFYRH